MSVKQSAKNQQKTVNTSLEMKALFSRCRPDQRKASIHTVANIAVGVLVGVAVMWF